MKCRNCNSCLTYITINNVISGNQEVYLFCDLCYNVYKRTGKNIVSIIEDSNIKEMVYNTFVKRTQIRRGATR